MPTKPNLATVAGQRLVVLLSVPLATSSTAHTNSDTNLADYSSEIMSKMAVFVSADTEGHLQFYRPLDIQTMPLTAPEQTALSPTDWLSAAAAKGSPR